MQRLALSADAPVTEIVICNCVPGAETRPLKSTVMTVGTIGEAAKLRDSFPPRQPSWGRSGQA